MLSRSIDNSLRSLRPFNAEYLLKSFPFPFISNRFELGFPLGFISLLLLKDLKQLFIVVVSQLFNSSSCFLLTYNNFFLIIWVFVLQTPSQTGFGVHSLVHLRVQLNVLLTVRPFQHSWRSLYIFNRRRRSLSKRVASILGRSDLADFLILKNKAKMLHQPSPSTSSSQRPPSYDVFKTRPASSFPSSPPLSFPFHSSTAKTSRRPE